MKLGLKDFKKIHDDDSHAVLLHPKGHKIVIAKSVLSDRHSKELHDLPIHKADGGGIGIVDEGLVDSQPDTLTPPASPPEQTTPEDISNIAPPEAAPESPQEPAQPKGWSAPRPFGSLAGAVGLEAGATRALGQSESDELLQQQALENEKATKIKEAAAAYKTKSELLSRNVDDARKAYLSGEIKPNHVFETMKTPQKIATAIGLLFGAAGESLGGVNHAQKWIDDQIKRDVDAQVANKENKKNLYTAYLQQYGDAKDAYNATTAAINGIYADKIHAAGLTQKSDQAKLKASQEVARLQTKQIPLIEDSAYKAAERSGQITGPESMAKTVKAPDGKVYQAYDAEGAKVVRKELGTYYQMRDSLKDLTKSVGANVNPFNASSARNKALIEDFKTTYNVYKGQGAISGDDAKRMDSMLANPGSWNPAQVRAQIEVIEKSVKNRMSGVLKAQLPDFKAIQGENVRANPNAPAGYKLSKK